MDTQVVESRTKWVPDELVTGIYHFADAKTDQIFGEIKKVNGVYISSFNGNPQGIFTSLAGAKSVVEVAYDDKLKREEQHRTFSEEFYAVNREREEKKKVDVAEGLRLLELKRQKKWWQFFKSYNSAGPGK